MYGRWNVVDVETHWDTIALSCTEIISRAVICVLRIYISSYVRLYPLLISNFHRFKIPTDKNFKFFENFKNLTWCCCCCGCCCSSSSSFVCWSLIEVCWLMIIMTIGGCYWLCSLGAAGFWNCLLTLVFCDNS